MLQITTAGKWQSSRVKPRSICLQNPPQFRFRVTIHWICICCLWGPLSHMHFYVNHAASLNWDMLSLNYKIKNDFLVIYYFLFSLLIFDKLLMQLDVYTEHSSIASIIHQHRLSNLRFQCLVACMLFLKCSLITCFYLGRNSSNENKIAFSLMRSDFPLI